MVVMIVGVDGAQEMREDPLGHVAALPSSLQVRKAKVDTSVDAGVDYVRGCIREAVIRACSVDGGWMVRGRYGEGHFVGPKEESEPTVPPKGGRLAYMNYSSHVDIWRRDLLHPEAAAVKMIASTIDQTNPNYSPDGKHIAFSSKRGGEWEIWMTDEDGKHLVRLSDSKTSRAGSPHWSPDSQKIAFDSRQSGHTEVDIVDITERLPRKLVTNLVEMSTPSWSRDGKWIYFQSTSDAKIFRCPASGGDAEALIAESGSFASESFDGKSVNFYSAASGGKLRTVSLNEVGVSREIEGMPVVNDQSQYTLVAGGIYYVPADAPKSVWYYDSNTKKVRKLFDLERYHNNTLSVSPDGRWMLYTQIDRQNSDIMLVENFR